MRWTEPPSAPMRVSAAAGKPDLPHVCAEVMRGPCPRPGAIEPGGIRPSGLPPG